jgi:hypothetical protein
MAATASRAGTGATYGSPSGSGSPGPRSTTTPESSRTNSTSGCAERMLTATATPPASSVPQNPSTHLTPAG